MLEDKIKIILQAALDQASADIHISAEEGVYKVYFRLGHRLALYEELKEAEALMIISHLKFLGQMDVGEKRRPQSGALDYALSESSVSLRLSTITDYRGYESIVIRLLGTKQEVDLSHNTFFHEDIGTLRKLLLYRSGFIVFSGPVSSGKTTTMYQVVKEAALESQRQVFTIEDPVEIEEASFLQTQVNPSAGITYDLLIRQALRHHPDIMIIGEIRDELTAHAALRAALTGHLVLATIHAKNARGVISRLEELGVTRDLLQQSLLGVIFQKMLPRYCSVCQGDCKPECKEYPVQEKRAVLYDICSGESLDRLFQPGLQADGFNEKLRRARELEKISEQTATSYYIP